MEALSAIKMFANQGVRESSLAKGGPQALQKGGLDSLSKVIPDSEIGQLKPFSQMFPDASGIKPSGGDMGLPSLGRVSGRDAFAETLGNLVGEVGAKQAASGDSVRGLITNQGVSLHQAMIAMEEASVSFQLMVEVRNKLLEGYQELMRMQV